MTATAGPLSADERHATALAGLGASPATLRRFLDGYRPVDAWAALARGEHAADPEQRYRAKTVASSPAAAADACARAGAAVTVLGSPAYPLALAGDRQAPAVLFSTGDLSVLDRRCRVAVVGTRSASRYGLEAAAEIGAGLAAAGVVVVSGLARGVDCAAHAGALGLDDGAPAVAVLGTALDAPVTPSQEAVRAAVAARGVVLSEIPPGAPGTRWWFAVRNRVMAALAHVVVVVECHERGGSLHTAVAARARGVPVAAVPGSIRSRASVGTNRLIAEGAVAVAGPDDVLRVAAQAVASCPQVTVPRHRWREMSTRRGEEGGVADLDAAGRAVWRSLDHDPALVEVVVRRSGLPVREVALALERLACRGLAVEDRGWWWRAP